MYFITTPFCLIIRALPRCPAPVLPEMDDGAKWDEIVFAFGNSPTDQAPAPRLGSRPRQISG